MAAIIPVKYYNTYILKKIAPPGISDDYDWYVEESRIKGGYNNVSTGLSPRAFLKSDNNSTETLGSTIIYSGIFNSRTGINQTNQFPSGQDITRGVNPANGTVQRLYAENTNLTIFQEKKVSRALIDKDAIYTQEGLPMQTASNVVIGGIVPVPGKWGISKNPESFAVYGYRKYFTDKDKGSVLRLAGDTITEISSYGMYDYFRDQFLELGNGKVFGAWDIHNKCYTLSLQPVLSKSQNSTQATLAFDENVLGWTSFYSYIPDQMFSIQNSFYSTKDGNVWQHYSTGVPRANFYGLQNDTNVTTIFNTQPSLSKRFRTVNFEGDSLWTLQSFVTSDGDTANSIAAYSVPTTLAQMETALLQNKFKAKENKYFANLVNTSTAQAGEVIFGQQVSGLKGFYATAKFVAANDKDTGAQELFAVSSDYNESSY